MSRFYQTSESPVIDYSFKLPYKEIKEYMDQKDLMQAGSLNKLSLLEEEIGKPVSEVDIPRNMTFRQNVKEQIDRLSEMDLTSPEGRREYSKLMSGVKKALSPGGEIYSQYNRYAAEQENIKRILDGNDVDPNLKEGYVSLLKKLSLQRPTNPNAEDTGFAGGQYQSFTPISPSKAVNFYDLLDRRIQGIKENETETKWDSKTGSEITTVKKGYKGITPERIMSVASDIINSDNDIAAYYSDLVMLGVADPNERLFSEKEIVNPNTQQKSTTYEPNSNNPLGSAIKGVMNKYSFTKTVDEKTTKYDDLWLEQQKALLELQAKNATVVVESDLVKIKPASPGAIANDYSNNIQSISSEISKIRAAGQSFNVKLPEGKKTFSQLNSMELKQTIDLMTDQGYADSYPALMQAAVNAQIALEKKEQNIATIEGINTNNLGRALIETRPTIKDAFGILLSPGATEDYFKYAGHRTQKRIKDIVDDFLNKSKYKSLRDLDLEVNKEEILKEYIRIYSNEGTLNVLKPQNKEDAFVYSVLEKTKGYKGSNAEKVLTNSKVIEVPVVATTNPGFKTIDPTTGYIVSDANANAAAMEAMATFDFSTIQLFSSPNEDGKSSTGNFRTKSNNLFKTQPYIETTPRNDGNIWGYVVDADGTKHWFRSKNLNIQMERKLPSGGAVMQTTNIQELMTNNPSYRIDGLVKSMAYNNIPQYNFTKTTELGPVRVEVNYKKAHANVEKIAKGENMYYNDADFIVKLNFSDGSTKSLNGPQAYNALLQYSEGATLPNPQPVYSQNQLPTK